MASSNQIVTTLPATGARDHAALALLPFSIASRSGDARTEPVTVAYQAEVDGKLRRVNVTLRPGAGTALPTPSDQMVFLALLQLGLRQDPPPARLDFQRGELVSILGWNDSGRNFERLREALQRLTSLTITVHAALVSRDGREYAREEEASHIIERYRVGNRAGGPSRIEWGHLVREAFRLGDFKRLDWDLLLALGNPLTAHLYRLLDRVTLAGQTEWSTGWRSLAAALGMGTGYDRPAKFRDKLRSHLDTLTEQGVIDGWLYDRGGTFVFRFRNYLRGQLRRVLMEHFEVYEKAAAQLVAGFDETVIMQQADCLRFREPKPREPAGYLVKAVREGYELRYPDDEAEAFAALWAMYGPLEREAYHRAGLSLLGTGNSLFDSNADPQAWTVELRAVVRFLLTWNIEPEEITGRAVTPGAALSHCVLPQARVRGEAR